MAVPNAFVPTKAELHFWTTVPLMQCRAGGLRTGQFSRFHQYIWMQCSAMVLFIYHSHPSWTFSLHDAPAKPTASWRTPPTPPTVSSSSYHQEDGTGASEPAPPDCSTAFSPRLWEPWTQITPPASETPCNPLPPETWTIPPPPPNIPQPYHTKEQNVNFFVQSKCATHRWVGLYKPPVVTHSPLCTRHFS